jgi:hypothetical protein
MSRAFSQKGFTLLTAAASAAMIFGTALAVEAGWRYLDKNDAKAPVSQTAPVVSFAHFSR